MQIPATSSASLVSTSLPVQCLQPSNFFFFRRIFADNFLPNLSQPRPERITTTSGTYQHHVRNVSQPRSERIVTTFRTYHDHVRNVLEPPRNLLEYVPNLLEPPPQRISTTSERIKGRLETSSPIHRKEGRSTLVAGCPSLSCGVYSVAPGRGSAACGRLLSR